MSGAAGIVKKIIEAEAYISKLKKDPNAQAAARFIQKATRKKFKSKFKSISKRYQVGEAPGTDLTKKTQYKTDGAIQHATNTFYAEEAVQIARQQNFVYSLGYRMRDVVYLSGIKVCVNVVNNHPTSNWLYFNLALVSAKNRGSVDSSDWFRGYQGDARSVDFTSGTLTSLDRHCLPINTDEWVVHTHERRLITFGGTEDESQGKKVAKVWQYEKYIPINRQIRFEGDGVAPETKFALVHYAGEMGNTKAAAAVPVANAYSVEMKIINVFREPIPMYKNLK